MNDNIGNLLIVSIGLVAWQAGCRFFLSETILGLRAAPMERIVPFSLDPSVPASTSIFS